MNRRLRFGLFTALCGTLALASGPAAAGPEGGQVVAGGATIAQSGAQTLVTQTTSRVAIDWTTFNVDAGELVRFVQPSVSAAALNRIADTQPSRILGAIEANGRVFLVNPSGIIFGEGARVNVGSLVASSLSIDPQRFMQGDYRFEAGAGEGGLVVNRGLLQAATGGSVTLMGGAVANDGLIIADYGRVDLGAGRAAVLDFDGDGLVGFKVTEDVLENAAGVDAAAANRGEIRADGGQVLVTARAARDVFSQVVNNEGVIRAARVDRSGGVVRLVGAGGTTSLSGTIDVDGATDADTGGQVDVLGDRVALADTARIQASGSAGGGTVRIGGDFHGAGADAANAERTDVAAGATVHADATAAGDGGRVAVWSDGTTRFAGGITARGGAEGGDGGFVEVSGKGVLGFAGGVDTSAPSGATGTLLLDPTTINVVAAAQDTTDLTTVDQFGDADVGAGSTAILVDSINTAGTNVVLQAEQDINFDTAVAMTGAGVGLTAQAGNDINTTNTITTNGGDVHLEADSPHATGGSDGTGTLTVSAAVTTGGGDVTLIGADLAITAAVNAGAGNVNLARTQDAVITIGGVLLPAELNQIESTGTVTLGQAISAGSDGLGTGATTLTASAFNLSQNTIVDAATAANLAVVTSGTFTASGALSLTTANQPLAITADDVVLGVPTAINTGSASVSLIDADGTGIGLGGTTVAGGLNVSGAELANITATGLTLRSAGPITVNGISAGNSNDISGTTTLTSTGNTVSFLTSASTFNTLAVNAVDGVTVGAALTTDTGGITVNADTDAGDENGTFTVSAAVNTGGNALSVTANDVDLTSTVNTGAGSATFIDSDAAGIGLGATPVLNGLNLSGAELANVTATGLTLQTAGDVTVDGVSAANSNNIAGATTLVGNTVAFATGASTFNTLAVNAADGVTVGAGVSTDTGGITVNADTDAGDENGTFTVSAAVNTGGNALSVTANDVDLTSTINTGAGSATFIDSDNTGIGLGISPVANGLNLANAELQNVTATGLTLQTGGGIAVNGITAANSNNVSGTTTLDAGSSVTVLGASTFNALSAQADNGIAVSAALTTDTGALALDGDADNAADGTDSVSFAAGVTVASAGALTLDATSGGLSGAGALTLNAADGVTANDTLTTAGTLTVNADTDAGDDNGTFAVNAALNTGGNALSVTANDMALASTVNTGAASATFIDSDNTGIGLGATGVTNGLNLTGAELQNVTATGLTLQTAGGMTVNGISAANSNNIAGTTTLDAAGTVTVSGASVFNVLDVRADDGIVVSAGLSTDTGALALDGDADNAVDGSDAVSFGAGVTVASASALTLDATSGGLTGAGALTLNAADGVTANDALTTAGTLTIDADTDAGDNNGTFTVNAALNTGGNALSVTANDLSLASTVNTGAASATFIDSDGTGIGLGATGVTNGLNLTGAELQNVTATGLTLQTAGGMTVDGISAANSNNVAGTTTLDATGTVTVSGASTFNALSAQAGSGIVVSGAAALTTDTGALALASAVNGGFGLTLNAATGLTLGAVGATNALASLTATGTTITLGGDVTTAAGAGNDVTFNGAVTLGSTVTVDAGGAATFNGALDATSAGAQGLTVQVGSGAAQFGAVGQSARLAALTVSGAGGATLGGNITANAVDLSALTGGTALGANLTVNTSAANGNLFLDGGALTGAGRILTLNAGTGTVHLADVAANGAELGGLNLTAGTAQLSGDVFTNGGLDFSGVTTTAVASGASILLATDSDNGTVNLGGTALQGPGTLQIQAGSGAVSLGAVGQATRLGALAVTTTGATTLGGNVSTSGAGGVDLSGVAQVTLGGDVTVNTATGNGVVDLSGGAVDGNQTLTVQGGSGAVTLGNTGQNVALAGLGVTAGGVVSMAATDVVTAAGNVSITGGQTSLNGVVESTGGTLAANSTAGALQLGQVRSAGAMTLGASSNILGDGRSSLDPRGANVVANSLVANAVNGNVGELSSFLVLDLVTTGVLNTKAAYTEVLNGSITSTGILFDKGFVKGDAGRGQAAVTSVARTLDPSLFNTDFNLFAVEEGGILAPPDQRDD